MDQYITTPITEELSTSLHAGDYVYLSGTIYVARDAAHKRMIEALESGKELPIDIKDSTIYYMGPSPAREGQVIGSVSVRAEGKEIGRYDLLAGNAVEEMTFGKAFLRLLQGLGDLRDEDTPESVGTF